MKDWSKHVNLSIISMIVVDTWLVFSAMRNTPTIELNQKEFYSVLAEELIDKLVEAVHQVNPDLHQMHYRFKMPASGT